MFRFLFLTVFAISFAFCIAQEPLANPTSLQFGGVKQWTAVLSFTPAQTDAGYLVLKGNAPITDLPADGIIYEKGQGLTTSKVIYNGAATFVPVKEMLENSTYHFAVFAYNGSGANINYKQINPLTGTLSTPAADAGNYYSAIDSASGNLVAALTALINPHSLQSYTPGYANNIIPNLFERDTTGNQKVINCEYTNETTLYVPPFSFSSQQYNREHVLCKSWMKTYPTYGANITNQPEGADYFNLLLTKATPNQVRSNSPLGIVLNASQTFGPAKYGTDNFGNTVFEPQNIRKGDAARSMFYEMICYDGKNGSWGLDYLLAQGMQQDVNILKLWHQQDPPDKFERTKNELIYSLQNNRNPFIDHPGWVNCINFDSLIKTAQCGFMTNVEELAETEWNVFPNPTSGTLQIQVPNVGFNYLRLMNTYGVEVFATHLASANLQVELPALSTGMYLLTITDTLRNQTLRKSILIHRNE